MQAHRRGIVTESVMDIAFTFAKPMIEKIFELSEREEPRFVHVAVADPYNDGMLASRTMPSIQALGMAEFNWGPEKWKRRYDHIAISKAQLSKRHCENTAVIAARHPGLLVDGDTHYEGGVYLHGIAVGVSGLESYLDEMIANIFASLINGWAKRKLEKAYRKPVVPFIGGVASQ